jgi:hypothetical protein
MDDILTKESPTQEDASELARLTYKKICINKLETYYFNQEKIIDRERIDLDEVIKSN